MPQGPGNRARQRGDALRFLPVALTGRGEIDEAIAQYAAGLRLKPDDARARNNLALIVSEREDIRKALGQERDRLARRPNDVVLLNELAWRLATSPRPRRSETVRRRWIWLCGRQSSPTNKNRPF